MKRSKRFEALEKRPVNLDGFSEEWADVGLIVMNSPHDPKPQLRIEDGEIVELDGKKKEEFDLIDLFISRYGIDLAHAEKCMAIPSVDIAKMLVDINVRREQIVKICSAVTPAKIVEIVGYLNSVEIMLAQMKMRTRKTPANQAHATNLMDNPVLIAADAAEAAVRGFAELETTCAVARYAPFNAMALLIGSQVGRGGVLTQCSMEEATELELGMRGLTSYAETVSVYGTDQALVEGDDTPWSKAFLASAYASRGIKMRFTSGTGSEVLMACAEKKSMLYLEARCIFLTKSAGVQGLQNGAINCIPLTAALPAGFLAIAAENLIASMLNLEVASGNDTTFSHSDLRRTAKLMMQMMPGTDFICSGFGGIPNFDNVFAGSNTDCDDYDDYYAFQRDMRVDGGIVPIREVEAIEIRKKASTACQALFRALDLPEISDEEVEAAIYAHSYLDMPKRNMPEDLVAAKEMMTKGITGFDIVKVFYENGFTDLADNILSLLKQRITGDYLQTAAILDDEFKVVAAINDANDYVGPGTGYSLSPEKWARLKKKYGALKPEKYGATLDHAQIPDSVKGLKMVDLELKSTGPAQPGTKPNEIVIALSPAFGLQHKRNITSIPHGNILKELMAGIEEEGLRIRCIRVNSTSDLASIASKGSMLSGSGISIGIQSKGTVVIHKCDMAPLDNLELFPQAPLYSLDIFRQIGKNAAKYAKGQTPQPVQTLNDQMVPSKFLVKATVLHIKETELVQFDKGPDELAVKLREESRSE